MFWEEKEGEGEGEREGEGEGEVEGEREEGEEEWEEGEDRAIQVFPSYFNLKRHFHKNLIS